MSRKLLEKPLALMQRFRTGSLDSQLVTEKSDTTLSLPTDSEEGKEDDSTRSADSSSLRKESVGEQPLSPEKKFHRCKPKGTIEYEVSVRDTLESIAAHHDTTPSEVMKLSRLTSRMLFPGQVLYLPDPDYVSSSDPEPSSPELSLSPPLSPPAVEERPRIDVPLVRMADKPPARVPGHVERQTPVSSPKDKTEFNPPQKLSEDEVKQLDQECFERFIKIHVKHITDGQGVVGGTLLVTPNAVMFDPNVSDPLVLEHGPEKYGMITPMDMVISAAMYHDIAAMRMRGKTSEDRATSPRPEVYHAKDCPLYHSQSSVFTSSKNEDILDGIFDVKTSRSSTVDSLLSETTSICSCGALSREQSVNAESPDYHGNNKMPHGDSQGSTENSQPQEMPDSLNTLMQKDVKTGENSVLNDSSVCSENISAMGKIVSKSFTSAVKSQSPDQIDATVKTESQFSSDFDANANKSCVKSLQEMEYAENLSDVASVGTDITDVTVDDEIDANKDMNDTVGTSSDYASAMSQKSETTQISISQDDPSVSFTLAEELSPSVIMDSALGEETNTEDLELNTEEDTNMRIGNIVYFPVEENSEGKIIVKGNNANVDTADGKDVSAILDPDEQPVSAGQMNVGFRTFRTSAHHLSNFVNYATGLFRSGPEDRTGVKDISDVIVAPGSDVTVTPASDKLPIVMSSSPVSQADPHHLEVENAVKLEDKPELFQTFDKLIARPATKMEEPPLFLCLRVGHPKNKEVSQTCPIESYRGNKKKPEYWFSIPRNKVDQLYAFFVQWTPEIYGDEDDLEPEKRGFVVIEEEEDQDEENLEIVDEHFASMQKIRKDWEIISKEEAIRRMSIDIEESMPPPEMIGETKLLTEEQVRELARNLPPRTIGYTWTLIYSTEIHGFSLKTLYRDMQDIDSPILMVTMDTSSNVFGAVTNCALKMSDHFYGTGESFLYTFYPEFKVFHWTGENNFFLKGNQESLAIGAGQGMFGLWFDGDLYHGRSHRCETFDNDVLSNQEDFIVKGLEAWAFL